MTLSLYKTQKLLKQKNKTKIYYNKLYQSSKTSKQVNEKYEKPKTPPKKPVNVDPLPLLAAQELLPSVPGLQMHATQHLILTPVVQNCLRSNKETHQHHQNYLGSTFSSGALSSCLLEPYEAKNLYLGHQNPSKTFFALPKHHVFWKRNPFLSLVFHVVSLSPPTNRPT